MSLLRLLNIQGIAGIAVSVALAFLLLVQRGETRHWKKESGRFEELYGEEQSAFTQTVANYRAAADTARAADRANLARVATEQRVINEGTSNDFEARLAAARQTAERLSAQRLRGQAPSATADPRRGGAAPVPGLPAPTSGASQTAFENGLPEPDALTATEQAIQLDELIQWVKRQAIVDPNTNEE